MQDIFDGIDRTSGGEEQAAEPENTSAVTETQSGPQTGEMPEVPKTPETVQSGAPDTLNYINFVPPADSESFWEETKAVKVRSFPRMLIWLIILMVVISIMFGYIALVQRGKGSFVNLFSSKKTIDFTMPIAETPELDSKYMNDDGSYTAAGLAKAVLPSVVQIKVYSQTLFTPSSQGSGIIMSEDGYIITNAHVVSGAKYGLTVMLTDEREFSATLVGMDEATDVAVLKIGAEGLTAAQFADSDTCELGDEVVAVGSPAGYANSVTKGIISGLDRQIRAEFSATPMQCIQIDAAINPGNSGGPLFNMWGQVIGITSSKLISSSYDNIGFAITTNSAKPIIEQLISEGFVPDRGRVGIYYYAVTEENAEKNGIPSGLYVQSIDPECNVADTELAEGDIITEMNGVPTTSQDDVNALMKDARAGDEMTMKVFRPVTDKDGNFVSGEGEYFEVTFELNSERSSIHRKRDEAKSETDE